MKLINKLQEHPEFLIWIFLTLLLNCSWFGPDIWYHLTWGRSLIENGGFLPVTQTLLHQPIVANGYWLFQNLIFLLFKGGGILLISCFFALLWFAVTYVWTRHVSAQGIGCLFFLAFVVCAQLRFEPRPEVLSYLFLSLFVLLLSRADIQNPLKPSFFIKIFVLQVLWTNCHGYFVLGPVVAFLYLLSLHGSTIQVAKRALLILALTLLATLINPFGIHMWEAVLSYAKVAHALREINGELMPPHVFAMTAPIAVFWVLWAFTTSWSFWNLVHWRNRFAAVLGLFGATLAILAYRNLPVYLILMAPIAGDLVLFLNSKLSESYRLLLANTACWGCVFLSAMIPNGKYHRAIQSLGSSVVHLEPTAYPIYATEYLNSIGFKGKIFCDSYDGGYLEFQLPRVSVVGDSYFSDANLTLKYFAAIREPRALKQLNQELDFDALLLNVENTEQVAEFRRDPDWAVVHMDSHRILLLRRRDSNVVSRTLQEYSFYQGEDLTLWYNSFGIKRWAEVALKQADVELMHKLLKDVHGARQVPADLIGFSLVLAGQTKDHELAELAKAQMGNMFSDSKDILDKVHSLSQQVN